jgi:hypothetical protein
VKKIIISASIALMFASSAYAAAVTSLSGTVVFMDSSNSAGSGPITQAPGIVWSSNNSNSVFGYTGGYGFAGNGYWDGKPAMIGSNSSTATMEYSFANLLSGVGGLINYAPGFGDAATISIFDSQHTLLESSVLNFATNGIGEFHGFQQSSANIAYFSLAGSFIGLRDLTITSVTAVPEPETYAMMLAGLGLMGAVARRRKAKLTA